MSCPGLSTDLKGAPSSVLMIVMAGCLCLVLLLDYCAISSKALSRSDERQFAKLVALEGVDVLFDNMCLLSDGDAQEASTKGFEAVLANLRAALDDSQLRFLFTKIDGDGDGKISRTEMQTYLETRPYQVLQKAAANAESQLNRTANSVEKSSKIGGVFMKLKLVFGFSQVVSNLSVSFDIVPWPKDFTGLMKFLELASADLIAALGATACELQTGFLSKFTVHMMLIPVLLVISMLSYMVARIRANSSRTFTRESALTGFYTVVSFTMFTVYIGVSTRIFRLFRCREIMGDWYGFYSFVVVMWWWCCV